MLVFSNRQFNEVFSCGSQSLAFLRGYSVEISLLFEKKYLCVTFYFYYHIFVMFYIISTVTKTLRKSWKCFICFLYMRKMSLVLNFEFSIARSLPEPLLHINFYKFPEFTLTSLNRFIWSIYSLVPKIKSMRLF